MPLIGNRNGWFGFDRSRTAFMPNQSRGWGAQGPLALGAALKTWVRADTVKGRTAAQFTAANNEFLSCTGTAALRGQSGTGGWWRACWIYLDNTGATLKGVWSILGSLVGHRLYVDSSAKIELDAGSGSAQSSKVHSTVLSVSTWYFVYFYYDGVNIGISINDGVAQTAALATYSPGTANLEVGRMDGLNTRAFDGRISCIIGGDGTLSGSQRTALYNAGSSLVYSSVPADIQALSLFAYDFKEESGTRADSVGASTLTDNNTVTSNDGNGTYAVTADGSVVYQGTDQGTAALVIQQATHTKKPLLKTNIINGQSVLRFDGTDDFLKVATGAISNQPLWGWCVVDDNDAATRYYLDGGAASKVMLRHDGTNLEINAGSDVGAAHTAGAPHLVTFIVNGASSDIRVDGASIATGDAGAQNQDSGVAVGSDNAGASPLAGDIAEFAFVAGSPSTLDIANLKSYINSRYNLGVA